jgi:hypothetical protein
MDGFAKGMIAKRQRDNKETASKAPKGFDILLADVISQFNLSIDDLNKLGRMTSDNKIAHAIVGNRTYYRRAAIDRLFPGQDKLSAEYAIMRGSTATPEMIEQVIVANG